MTYLELPRPAHLTHERLALRATIIRFTRRPIVEITTASVIVFAIAIAGACQIGN